MAKTQISTRRIAISKSNAQVLAALSVAAFITIFSLVASKTIYSQNQYQGKVVEAKEKALNQLEDNLDAFEQLQKSYNAFNRPDKNVIGGNKVGQGDKDGSNSKLILDALPSQYDFPALASSLEKLLIDKKLKVGALTGTDDELTQQTNISSESPQEVPMPFGFSVNNSNYTAIQDLVETMQRSIRPLAIDTLNVSGDQNDLTLTVTGHSYFQPGRSVNITEKVIK